MSNNTDAFFNLKQKIEKEAETYVNKIKKCLCCAKEIHSFEITDMEGNRVNIINPYNQHQSNWDDSIVAKISGGFGSRHDLASYYIAICDKCVSQKLEEGIIEDCREIEKKIPEEYNWILSKFSRR